MTDQAERDAYKSANDGEDLPQTYDEWLEVDIDRYERICQHFTRPDEDLYGTAFQWSKVYDFVSSYAYPFMFSTRGEAWDPATGQVEGIAQLGGQYRRPGAQQALPPVRAPRRHNYGIADEPAIFTAGTIATCWEWAALGPQMLNQKIPGEPGEVADPAKPVTPGHGPHRAPPGFRQEDGTLSRIYTWVASPGC